AALQRGPRYTSILRHRRIVGRVPGRRAGAGVGICPSPAQLYTMLLAESPGLVAPITDPVGRPGYQHTRLTMRKRIAGGVAALTIGLVALLGVTTRSAAQDKDAPAPKFLYG